MSWDWGWTAVEAIATWVLVGGIGIAVWQLWEARKRARIEFTERRLEELNTEEIKEAEDIIKNKRPSLLIDLVNIDRVKVVQLLERMQALGLLVKKGYADKELAIISHRGKFIRCWYILKPLIYYERKKVRGKYGEGIEYLAIEAYKYQQNKIKNKDEWVKLDGEVCIIDTDETC